MNSNFSFYDWVKKIPGDVLPLDEIPLLGFPPPFPWDALASQLNRSLQIEGLKLQPEEWQWRPQNELFSGIGDQLQTLRFNVGPLAGSVTWVMAQKDVTKLLSLLLSKTKNLLTEVEVDFLESFTRFLAVETINAFEKIDFDKQLSVMLLADKTPPSEISLCLDILISFQNETMRGRLCLSPEFRKSWKERYLSRQKDVALKSPLAEKLNLVVNIEGGKTHLTMSEWKTIHPGDVLILDSCSLDVGEDKGRVMLTINGISLFRAKVKQGSLKILEHPLYHEVDTTMNKDSHEDEEDEFGEDEEEVTEDEDLDYDESDEDEESEIEESEIEEEFEFDGRRRRRKTKSTRSPPPNKTSSS